MDASNVKISVNHSNNVKIKPEISFTHEKESVKIKIELELKRIGNFTADVPKTPQEMVAKYKLHNDIQNTIKPCW